jgi:hypothetical protein
MGDVFLDIYTYENAHSYWIGIDSKLRAED